MIFLKTIAIKENKHMFLNTTLDLVRHESVKRQGNKSGKNRQPVKICFRQSHNSQQDKCMYHIVRDGETTLRNES